MDLFPVSPDMAICAVAAKKSSRKVEAPDFIEKLKAEMVGRYLMGAPVDLGARLLSAREMVADLGVSSRTLSTALAELAEEGILRVQRPLGIYFKDPAPMVRYHKPHGMEALVLPQELMFDPMRRTLERALARKGVSLLERYYGWNRTTLDAFLRTHPEMALRVDGMVLRPGSGMFQGKEWRQWLRAPRHLILVDSLDPVDGVDQIGVDRREEGRLVGEHLRTKGHRRLGWVGPVPDGVHFRAPFERHEGLCQALEGSGIPVPAVFPVGDFKTDLVDRQDVFVKWIRSNKVTALVTWGDLLGHQVVNVLALAGLKVPGDVAVAGFGRHEAMWNLLGLTLTSVDPKFAEQGAWAAERWLLRSANPFKPVDAERKILTPVLVPGPST